MDECGDENSEVIVYSIEYNDKNRPELSFQVLIGDREVSGIYGILDSILEDRFIRLVRDADEVVVIREGELCKFPDGTTSNVKYLLDALNVLEKSF